MDAQVEQTIGSADVFNFGLADNSRLALFNTRAFSLRRNRTVRFVTCALQVHWPR
jgi:hypothetical protein